MDRTESPRIQLFTWTNTHNIVAVLNEIITELSNHKGQLISNASNAKFVRRKLIDCNSKSVPKKIKNLLFSNINELLSILGDQHQLNIVYALEKELYQSKFVSGKTRKLIGHSLILDRPCEQLSHIKPKFVLDEVVKEELTSIMKTVRFRVNKNLHTKKVIDKAAKYGHHCCVNLYKTYCKEYNQGERVKQAKAYFVLFWRAFSRIIADKDISDVHLHWSALKQDVE